MPSLALPHGEALVALGSNLGDRLAHLEFALDRLARLAIGPLARSRLYDTAPFGPPQPRYLNAAVRFASPLPPEELLAALLSIERERGRERVGDVRNGPRTLDLDLLLHGAEARTGGSLVLPHPRMSERTFVLAPAYDVAPDLPILGEWLARSGGAPDVVTWRDQHGS